MRTKMSGCRKCRKVGEKLCSKAARCALERRSTSPGQYGKKPGMTKLSEYGRQLREKQKVKYFYGVLERQFRRTFDVSSKQKGVTGENLLANLERRLDNVLFRLKMATSRPQARQMVVHGLVQINGKRVKSPSYFVTVGDKISLTPVAMKKEAFMDGVVKKRINIAIKVPDWLELQKEECTGVMLRMPARTDIKIPIEEHLIVELYSK